MTDKTALAVENLKVIFPGPAGVVRAVEGSASKSGKGNAPPSWARAAAERV